MACEDILQVGIIGALLEVEVLQDCNGAVLNLQTATLKEVTVKRPDDSTFTRSAVFTSDGSDGLIYIATQSGDITLAGTYYIQAYLELPTWQGNSDIGEFDAQDNL
jgi:hypothetical protein